MRINDDGPRARTKKYRIYRRPRRKQAEENHTGIPEQKESLVPQNNEGWWEPYDDLWREETAPRRSVLTSLFSPLRKAWQWLRRDPTSRKRDDPLQLSAASIHRTATTQLQGNTQQQERVQLPEENKTPDEILFHMPKAAAVPPTSEELTRMIWLLPRGPGRLDAFAQLLPTLPAHTEALTGVAEAFHRELLAVSSQANIDLSLLGRHVDVCAEFLRKAGLVEKAAALLNRIGKRHKAAELFIEAGDVESLIRAHAQIDAEDGHQHSEAKLAYERFDVLFNIGRRQEALIELQRATVLWADNHIYASLLHNLRQRLLHARSFLLRSGDVRLAVRQQLPLSIGRGEEADLRLASPLISRVHARLELDEGNRLLVRDLSHRGSLRWRGEVVSGDSVWLDGAGTLELSNSAIDVHFWKNSCWLWPLTASSMPVVVPLDCRLTLPSPLALAAMQREKRRVPYDEEEEICLEFDTENRVILQSISSWEQKNQKHKKNLTHLALNSDVLNNDAILLAGDRISNTTVPIKIASTNNDGAPTGKPVEDSGRLSSMWAPAWTPWSWLIES